LEHFLKDGDEKDAKLKELRDKKLTLLKELMIAKAKHNNKKLTQDDLKKIYCSYFF